jgi:hypothetical protein
MFQQTLLLVMKSMSLTSPQKCRPNDMSIKNPQKGGVNFKNRKNFEWNLIPINNAVN